jgi:hypothetical protein
MSSLCLGLTLLAVDLGVVVAPFQVLGLSEDQAVELRRLTEELVSEGRRERTAIPAAELERARQALEIPEEELDACLNDPTCASRLAREAGADELLLGTAAGLGRNYVLHLALIDAHRSVVDREVQGTVVGGFDDLTSALPSQLDRLLPRRQPWYSRWWVWTVAGLVVAGAVVATVLAVTLTDDSGLDTYPLP